MVGIVAIGMTFVILTGGIDLSVGSVAGLTGVIFGLALQQFPIPVSIACAIVGRGRHRFHIGRPDRLVRTGRVRRDPRHDGDRPEPCLHTLRGDVDH